MLDSGVIRIELPSHLHTEAVEAMCAARQGSEEISDACAVTIASWWQSPGSEGRAFAALASTGSVGLEDLLSDIHKAWVSAGDLPTSSERESTRLQLDMLATWAIDRGRPTAGDIMRPVAE